jgi:hypothetical protein
LSASCPQPKAGASAQNLLAGTLAEASDAHACCYLETFTPRNLQFYESLGFRRVAEHLEPVTEPTYAVMVRDA